MHSDDVLPLDATAAARELFEIGFGEIATLPNFQFPGAHTTTWRSPMTLTTLGHFIGACNLGARTNSLFAITVWDSCNANPPQDLAAYKELLTYPTLRLQAARTATFVYKHDFLFVSEGKVDSGGPLSGCEILCESGILAFGLVREDGGMPVRVERFGSRIATVHEHPSLQQLLATTFRFQGRLG